MRNAFQHLLGKWLSTGQSGTMDVDSDAFLDSLARSQYHGPDIDPAPVEPEKDRPLRWWEIPYLKGVRFIAIAGITILMTTIVIHYAIIYVNDVILHENQLHINSQGAFNPHKSMNCEYALYLFNTADLWANSGIQVNRKDWIKVNISGGYNSAIEGDVLSAMENTELKYPWRYYDAQPDRVRRGHKNKKDLSLSTGNLSQAGSDTTGLSLCIYRSTRKDREAKNIAFGSALYGIFPESSDIRNNPVIRTKEQADRVRNWSPKEERKFHRAEYSGTLFFAVNDLFPQNDDEVEEFYANPDNRNFKGQPFSDNEINARKRDVFHDYEDNLGQLMVSVEIRRHVPYSFFKPIMAYRFLEYSSFRVMDDYKSFTYKAFALLGRYLCFIGWIMALFFVWTVLLVGFIYLLFFLGHQIYTLGERIFKRPARASDPS